jgi:hypothetical protein
MKNIIGLIAAGILITFLSPVSAQKFSNDKPITIDNMAPGSVWQIAEMAMNENQIKPGKLNMAENTLQSDWIEWTAIAIQNHARLYLIFEDPILTVKIADREYMTKQGWSEAVGNLSKKNYADYVQSVADRIKEINASKELTTEAVRTSKLIHAFFAVNKEGGLVFTLMKANKPEDNRPELEFTVTNTSSSAVNTIIKGIPFATTGTAAGKFSWSKPEAEKNTALIQPGETQTLTVKLAPGYNWSKYDSIEELSINFETGTATIEKHKLTIYNIPLKDFVYHPEE